jgi:hypothetical protein
MASDEPEDSEDSGLDAPGGSGKMGHDLESAMARGELGHGALASAACLRGGFENTAAWAWAAGRGTATGVQVLATDAQAARAIIDDLENRIARREAQGSSAPAGKPGPAFSLRPAGRTRLIFLSVLDFFQAAICACHALGLSAHLAVTRGAAVVRQHLPRGARRMDEPTSRRRPTSRRKQANRNSLARHLTADPAPRGRMH